VRHYERKLFLIFMMKEAGAVNLSFSFQSSPFHPHPKPFYKIYLLLPEITVFTVYCSFRDEGAYKNTHLNMVFIS
jgi:hypothetical protein